MVAADPRRTTPEWRRLRPAREGRDRSRPRARTITLTLTEPDSSLLWTLTGRAGIIFKEGDNTDYNTAANGTGPFMLDTWRQGDSIVFARNDAYWGEPATGRPRSSSTTSPTPARPSTPRSPAKWTS